MEQRQRRANGFSLLELLLVLALLAGLAGLIAPRLPSLQTSDLRSSARQCAALLRYLDERAVGSKQHYRLRIDLDRQRLDVVRRSASGDELPPDDPFLQRNPLQQGVQIVSLATERLGVVTSGTVRISYGPGGLSEPLRLQLGIPGRKSGMLVEAFPAGSVVRLRETTAEESQ